MTHETVLIVEDDAVIACSLEQALREAGYEVCDVAASEEEAIVAGARDRPQLAVVDVNLSPGDGRVVARKLADRFNTVILMATAHCGDVGFFAETHAQACLPKPYNPADVASALEAARSLAEGREPERTPDGLLRLASAA